MERKNRIDCLEIETWTAANPHEAKALARRFEELDSTLSLEEIAKAYIGHAYADGYCDMGLDRMQLDQMMTNSDMENALRLAWNTSCDNPFNLDALDVLLRIVPEEHEIWKVAAWRFSRLLKAIASTGDGTSILSAFIVTSTRDEFMLMKSMFELQNVTDRHLIVSGTRSFDKYVVTPTHEYPHNEIFFEITPFNTEAP